VGKLSTNFYLVFLEEWILFNFKDMELDHIVVRQADLNDFPSFVAH
jgi:hypothetical protein